MDTPGPRPPSIPVKDSASSQSAGSELTLNIPSDLLVSVFGVTDPDVAATLLSQIVNVVHPDPKKPVDEAVIREALALIEGIKPADTLEAMTATMLVAAQHAALDAMRRAAHPEQTPAGRQSYTALSLKAMRTFAQLMETLNNGRGKGSTQRVIVERVNVEPGGQAVVGAFGYQPGGQIESRQQSQEPRNSSVLPRPERKKAP